MATSFANIINAITATAKRVSIDIKETAQTHYKAQMEIAKLKNQNKKRGRVCTTSIKKRRGSIERCAPPKDGAGPSFRYDKGDEDGPDYVFSGISHKLGGQAGVSRLVA